MCRVNPCLRRMGRQCRRGSRAGWSEEQHVVHAAALGASGGPAARSDLNSSRTPVDASVTWPADRAGRSNQDLRQEGLVAAAVARVAQARHRAAAEG